jgi:hypothetical protein
MKDRKAASPSLPSNPSLANLRPAPEVGVSAASVKDDALDPNETHKNLAALQATGETSPAQSLPPLSTQQLHEVLQALLDKNSKKAWFKTLLSQLIVVFVGFTLTVLVGGYLTQKYAKKQQEIAAERSFSDELTKQQIQKVAEVWEKLDQDEVLIDRLLADSNLQISGEMKPNDRAKEVTRLIQEDKTTIAKYRFWLGSDAYTKIQDYLDLTVFYATKKLLDPDSSTDELLQKRKAAKSDIDSERLKFRTGYPLKG